MGIAPLTVEVRSENYQESKFTYKSGPRAGTQGVIYKQVGWIHLLDPIEGSLSQRRLILQLEGPEPYPVGFYAIAPDCYYIDDYSELRLGRLRLDFIATTTDQIGVTRPTNQPGATQPAATQPRATPPGAIQPGAIQPRVTPPGATQPGATQPGATQPGATQPGHTKAA